MKREIIITSDGSTTIHLPDWNEQYHSKHGAIQEAYHVLIEKGLRFFCHAEQSEASNKLEVLNSIFSKSKITKSDISILEIGFGTGLNCFITFLEANQLQLNINYVGIEAYPVSSEEIQLLNYIDELNAQHHQAIFNDLHEVSWNDKHRISENFQLTKRKQFFSDINDENSYDIIYFDAFGARNQPELWTEEIFSKMFKALKKGGVLTTYAAKGSVRRAMQTVGFMVERLEGPPGKREMLRAVKQ